MGGEYAAFLEAKRLKSVGVGFEVPLDALSPALFPFARRIVRWALRRGRAALFEDTGLTKTRQQIEWAMHVHRHTGGDVLILAPLAVARQTEREAAVMGYTLTVCKSQADARPGINVVNYDRLHLMDATAFVGLVADESSCLKAFGSIERKRIVNFAAQIPYRLACTATPAPNDLVEIINHAEFLGVMQGKEMIALFFTQDGNTTHKWRLKGHARRDFWRWLATWAVAIRRPSDLGESDEGFILPPLRMHQTTVKSEPLPGRLVAVAAASLGEQRAARKQSLPERVAAAAEIVNETPGAWVCWCDLNAESSALAKAIPDAVEIVGSDTTETKEQRLADFASGKIRVLVSKASICGWGLNWQHCHQMTFVGLSYSFEQMYQAIRRCYRFGQRHPVDCHVIVSDAEGVVIEAIRRKEQQAQEMMGELVKEMAELSLGQTERQEMAYREDVATGKGWTLYLGDSVEVIDKIATESVGLALTSPPFPGMYVYTNSVRDMGNVPDIPQMLEQFRYLIGPEKMLRVLMPGRLFCVHLSQTMAHKSREGYIGIHDFRGEVIAAMIAAGWIYAGEVTIDKDPQVKASRTKEMGLLYKTLSGDSTMCRMTLADYLIYFRKPGENPQPIKAGVSARYNPGAGWITEDEWNEWAGPVWYRKSPHYPGGIKETEVLNVVQARETDDERHLCPLQLGVIDRAIKLWSAPGDLVYDPFNGIGSVGYEALQLGRRYIGSELKESYWRNSQRNLNAAEQSANRPSLLDVIEAAG